MPENKDTLQCYNRGCGKKYDPNDNPADACQHHPGAPVFHDAYKGWSCCSKKCIDFTEFLNIKGCARSPHSNVKPEEPAKPKLDESKAAEAIEVVQPRPLNKPAEEVIARPDFEAAQVSMKAAIAPTLAQQIDALVASAKASDKGEEVAIGQSCKNNACKSSYKGAESNEEVCRCHPGEPIFHEGMKYWSCCKKRTTDFNVFLEQPGCSEGKHVWVKKDSDKKAKCRLDWHQTELYVIVSIFAKKYHPEQSFVKLNPVHLTVELYFPEEDSKYNLDIELQGIVDVENSSVSMLPSKTEIKLRKRGPGSWSELEIPRGGREEDAAKEAKKKVASADEEENMSSQVDAVDLSDL